MVTANSLVFREVPQHVPKLVWTDLSLICLLALCTLIFMLPFHTGCCFFKDGPSYHWSSRLAQCRVKWLLKPQVPSLTVFINSQNSAPLFFFKFIHLYFWETELEWGRGRERERHRIQTGSGLCLSYKHRAQHGTWTHEAQDNDLSWIQMFNQKSLVFKAEFIRLIFSVWDPWCQGPFLCLLECSSSPSCG